MEKCDGEVSLSSLTQGQHGRKGQKGESLKLSVFMERFRVRGRDPGGKRDL